MTSVTPSTLTAGLEKNRNRFYLVIIFVLGFIMAARTPLDTDMWWHIRAGQQTVQAGHPVVTDLNSFTRPGAAWTNVHWLFQVLMYEVYQSGGFTLLGGMVALIIALSLLILTFQMDGPVLFKGFLLILTSLVSAPVWVARPEIGSLLLMAVVGYVLYLYKWRRQDRLWALIPVFILWANIHPGYVLGLLLIGGMLAGEILNHLVWVDGEDILSWRQMVRLGLWGVGCGFALLINPTGIHAWILPFQTVGINVLQNAVNEWASPDFHQFFQQPYIWLLLLTPAAIGFSTRRLDGTDLVTFAGFAYLGLVARRNFGPFAMAATPILARYLWAGLQTWSVRTRPIWEDALARLNMSSQKLAGLSSYNPQRSRLINLGVFAFLVLVAAGKLYYSTFPVTIQTYEATLFPVKAVAWMESHHPQGNLFNSYNWGGYLEWTARDFPIYVDGRTDIYGDEIVSQYLDVVNAKEGWQKTLDKWSIHLILLEPTWPVVNLLPANGWKILYQDNVSVLYGR